MRRSLIVIGGFIFLLAIAGLVVWSQSNRTSVTLSDGSVVRIEKVAFGKLDHFAIGGPWDKLKAQLPVLWQKKFFGPAVARSTGSWRENSAYRTNESALYLYITRRMPGQGYRNVDIRQIAFLTDEDGCMYFPTQTGGWDDGKITNTSPSTGMGYSVGWFRFDAFPRRQKKFQFEFSEKQGWWPLPVSNALFKLKVFNPAPLPVLASWTVENLPLTQNVANVSFVLKSISIQTNTNIHGSPVLPWRMLEPAYDVIENGQLSTNWMGDIAQLEDTTGNFVGSRHWPGEFTLCPREPAWKMRVRFFGSEHSQAASNSAWTLRSIAVPAAGKTTALTGSNTLQNISIRPVTMCGPGNYTFSNGIALKAEPPKNPIKFDSTRTIAWPKKWNGNNIFGEQPTIRCEFKNVHIAFQMDDMLEDQRLTVRAVDDQGREFYGSSLFQPPRANSGKQDPVTYLNNWYRGQGTFVAFDLPEDSKTIDLTFCVHTCRTADFIFNPTEALSAK